MDGPRYFWECTMMQSPLLSRYWILTNLQIIFVFMAIATCLQLSFQGGCNFQWNILNALWRLSRWWVLSFWETNCSFWWQGYIYLSSTNQLGFAHLIDTFWALMLFRGFGVSRKRSPTGFGLWWCILSLTDIGPAIKTLCAVRCCHCKGEQLGKFAIGGNNCA